VLGLMAKIVHIEECDSFLIGIIESACEMFWCEILCSFLLFPFIPTLSSDYFLCLRYLFGFCCWGTSDCWTNYGSREGIRGDRQFVVRFSTPSWCCVASRSCSAYQGGSWWLSKISHNYAFCHASSQSSAWKLSVATRYF
jgi:hypothetical protein